MTTASVVRTNPSGRRKPPDRIFYEDKLLTTRPRERPFRAWVFLVCERDLSRGVDRYRDVVEIGPAKSRVELGRLIETFIAVAKAQPLPDSKRE